jgi:hypothetical protein
MAQVCDPPQLTDDEVANEPKKVTIVDECERMRVGATLTIEKSLTETPGSWVP